MRVRPQRSTIMFLVNKKSESESESESETSRFTDRNLFFTVNNKSETSTFSDRNLFVTYMVYHLVPCLTLKNVKILNWVRN